MAGTHSRLITMSSSIPIERLQNVHVKVGGEKKALHQTRLVVTDRNTLETTFALNDGFVNYIELSGIKGECTATATVFCTNDNSWSIYDVPSVAGKITYRIESYVHSCSVVVNGAQQFTVVLYFVLDPEV